MKKILSAIFAAALVASMFVVGAVSTSAAEGDYTIYFEVPSDETLENLKNNETGEDCALDAWGSSVVVHAWNDSGNLNGDWPGAEATKVEGTDNIYSYTWSADNLPTGIIFNNGDNGVQTCNIDGKTTTAKSDASLTKDNPAIEWGKLYKATGEGFEDANGNTNVWLAAEDYTAPGADTSTDDTASADDTASTDDTSSAADTTSTATESSDASTVKTGDTTTTAWILIAVVVASLGTAVVMTKKASAKD